LRINDTIEYFLNLYEKNSNFNLSEYQQSFPEVFQTYFGGYCKKTNERMIASSERYHADLSEIKRIRKLLPGVIEKVAERCSAYFGFSIDVPIHIFIGLYASNAFVDHHSSIYLAAEKLHPDSVLLEIILTHEMVHSYHNHILDQAGIDWLSIDWDDVRNSIYREGIATYFSQLISPGHKESIYYSYDYNGDAWLSFCKGHIKEISKSFIADIENEATNMEQEWLRLSGGRHFVYNRLGYFLGSAFVHHLCKNMPETDVLTLLINNKVCAAFDSWIIETIRN